MPFALNWNPKHADRSVDHTRHQAVVQLTIPSAPNFENDLYINFRDFTHFDGHHNKIAVVYGKHVDGVCYAMFDTGTFFGWASSKINPRVVPVRIWCDPALRRAVGDTAGDHMLVGQRRWWVELHGNVLTLATEAYERPRNLLNTIGMHLGGRFVQMKIWRAYLQNICDAYELPATFADEGPTREDKTPWTPQLPYPGCDCKI